MQATMIAGAIKLLAPMTATMATLRLIIETAMTLAFGGITRCRSQLMRAGPNN